MADSDRLVHLTRGGGVIVAAVRAPAVDTGNAERLVEAVGPAIDAARGLRGLVLDLSSVGFLNSRGLAACIDLARRAEAAGAAAVACGLGPDLARMFEVMRVDRLLAIVPDVDAAREHLRRGTSGRD